MSQDPQLESVLARGYQHGFVTEIESDMLKRRDRHYSVVTPGYVEHVDVVHAGCLLVLVYDRPRGVDSVVTEHVANLQQIALRPS